jgi:hypothetical protein
VGKKRAREVEQARAVFLFASEMEHPLEQARSLAVAMRLLGQGMIADYNPEYGEPVFAIADAVKDRLEEVLNLWEKLFEAAGTLAPADRSTP